MIITIFPAQSDAFKMTCFVCPTVQNQDPSFTIINDKEKQQTFTLDRLKPGDVWYFCLIDD